MISEDYFRLIDIHNRLFAQWMNELRQIDFLTKNRKHDTAWYLVMCIEREKNIHNRLKKVDEKLYLLSWVGA